MFYTGIGCREEGVPVEVAFAQVAIAAHLAHAGLVLRSGHASGSDINFERGAASISPNKTSIYLPWGGFRKATNIDGVNYLTLNDKAFQWARKQLIKSEVLPKFDKMDDMTQAFHARNVFQVLGKEKVKSDFVVYYAPTDEYGQVLGGTRTAVNLAMKLGIPTYNLRDNNEAMVLLQRLDHLNGGRITKQVHNIYASIFKES
jgi:hypothetical protein